MSQHAGLSDYRIACDHDRHGRETDAIPCYERALALGLDDDDRRSALLGLGSSLRNVGKHAESVATLTAATSEFPEDAALRAFLALACYSNGDAKAAVQRLLDLAIEHAPVGAYARALTLYRDRL